MNLFDELLEGLNIKKANMCVEVNSFDDQMKAYFVIIPIEDKNFLYSIY